MRVVRIVALVVSAGCLVFGALALLTPVEMTMCAGDCRTVSCGSPAFPKALIDLDGNVEDAANCAGLTSASVGLWALLGAGAGVVVMGVATWRGAARPRRSSPPDLRSA